MIKKSYFRIQYTYILNPFLKLQHFFYILKFHLKFTIGLLYYNAHVHENEKKKHDLKFEVDWFLNTLSATIQQHTPPLCPLTLPISSTTKYLCLTVLF